MKIIIDTDFLLALYNNKDSNHKTASKLLQQSLDRKDEFFLLNLVVQEIATVISYKIGQKESLEFLTSLKEISFTRIEVDQKLEQKAWEIFKKQTKKGTAFVDCANLAAIEIYKMDGILSFDRFFAKLLVTS